MSGGEMNLAYISIESFVDDLNEEIARIENARICLHETENALEYGIEYCEDCSCVPCNSTTLANLKEISLAFSRSAKVAKSLEMYIGQDIGEDEFNTELVAITKGERDDREDHDT